MGEQVYNTAHSYFLLKNENREKARAAFDVACGGSTFDNLEDALELLGFNSFENDEGDIIDVFLKNSYVRDEKSWETLKKVMAPFVEVGSHLIFFTGDQCTALVFVEGKEPGTVEAVEDDVECVTTFDMYRILSVLADTGNDLWAEMNKKYGTGEIEGEDGEEDDVPEDKDSELEISDGNKEEED